MSRINVRGEFGQLAGWFNDSTLRERIDEARRWNGNNMIGVISGGQVGYEQLLLTSGRRWVRNSDFTHEFIGPDLYEFLTDEQARTWLLRNETDEHDALVEKYFDAIEAENGPPGRPEIGGKTILRLGDERQTHVDALAAAAEISRAEMVRTLLDEALIGRQTTGDHA